MSAIYLKLLSGFAKGSQNVVMSTDQVLGYERSNISV